MPRGGAAASARPWRSPALAKHPAKCPKCGNRLEYDPAVGGSIVCANCQATLRVPGKAKAPSATESPTQTGVPPQPHDPLIGQMLAEFEIIELLGRGGMGAVYKARQPSLDRLVAIKVLPPRLASDASFVERFNREARSAAAVRHPNIIEIFAVGQAGGHQFIAMEFIEGETLADTIKREGRLAPDRALEILKHTASALEAAHACGILHRDIKPSNILIDTRGWVKVADFGLAKQTDTDISITVTGQALGTPLYIPPEAARGHKLDARSDLYSLGATFYHAFAGRPPFLGNSGAELILKHAEARVPPLNELAPDVPAPLCRIIHRLLRKSPADRYDSAGKLLEALARVEARVAQAPSPVSRVAQPPSAVGAAGTKTLPPDARPKRATTARKEAVGGASLPRVLPRWVWIAAPIAAIVLVVLILVLAPKGTQPPPKVAVPPSAPRAPSTAHRPPGREAAAAERNAATVLKNIQTCISKKDWKKAESYLARLNTKYGNTQFAAAHKADIAALRQQIDIGGGPAPVGTTASKPRPVVAEDDARWTEWQDLFDGKTLDGWHVPSALECRGHGRVAVEDGAIRLAHGRNRTGVTYAKPLAVSVYELAYEEMFVGTLRGQEAGVMFPCGARHVLWPLWPRSTNLYQFAPKPAAQVLGAVGVRLAADGWHHRKLRVEAHRIQAWIDGVQVIDFDLKQHKLIFYDEGWVGGFGGHLAFYITSKANARLRAIRLRRLRPAPPPADEARWGPWEDLFDGKTLKGWRGEDRGQFSQHGSVHVDKGLLVLREGRERTGIAWNGDFPTEDYDLSLEARGEVGRTGDFLHVFFPVGAARCVLLNGYNRNIHALDKVDGQGTGVGNPTVRLMSFDPSRWYVVRIRVTKERIQVWVDEKQTISLARQGHTFSFYRDFAFLNPLGISTWQRSVALRSIRLRRLKPEPPKVALKPREPTPEPGEKEKLEPPTIAKAPPVAEKEDATAKAVAAYGRQSQKVWALFKERKYGEAENLIAQLSALPEFTLATPHVQADAEAARLLRDFWKTAEKGLTALKGRTLFIKGVGGTVKSVKDGVITIEPPRGERKRGSVRDLTPKQVVHYSGLKLQADAHSKLVLAVFLLAERAELDEAKDALAKAGGRPAVAIYQVRLDTLMLGTQEVAARAAWRRIEGAARGRLTRSTARRLKAMLHDLEKQHGQTKFYKGLGEALDALKARIAKAAGPTVYTKWPFDTAEARRRQKATAEALGVKVEQDIEIAKGVKLTMVLIPAGEFLMGSPPTTSPERLQKFYGGKVEWYQPEFPRHRVKISKPFWLGKTEVTQAQWQAVMGDNPSKFKGKPQNPVEQVDWHDCQGFLQKLSARVAQPPSAVPGGTQPRAAVPHFRLPTEAEWEYACRAGTPSEFYFGDSQAALPQHAWFAGNSGRMTHPVGGRKPNAWGMHDMAGNVWEWCEDRYAAYGNAPQVDPKGPEAGAARVLRGGSWFNGPPVFFRCAYRYCFVPDRGYGYRGFRASRAVLE